MKRHRALEPFSRDHNDGLILARALEEGRDLAMEQVREAWRADLSDHFHEEERLLGPLCSAKGLARMVAEHRDIAARIDALPAEGAELGRILGDHIRWEERELFPAIESSASEAALAQLLRDAEHLERRRWDHNPRRGVLVQRRWTEWSETPDK